MSISHVYAAEIAKSYRDDNGDLVVEGIATSPDLDLDQQVCDPVWLKSAMPDWFKWGNIREQHGPNAAGTGTELEQQDGDRWHLKSIVVDPIAQKKVETKVYKGYSIGIKDPRVVKDAAAPGGRIVGGSIVEVSLVDRPCNPVATLALTKAAKPGMSVKAVNLDADRMLVKVEEIVEHPENADKPDVTVTVGETAVKGAMPPLKEGGKPRYPITDVASLKDAIQAYGRAKASDKDEVKAHIISEAKRLGRADLIPDNWTKAAGTGTHDPDDIAAIRDGLVGCINAELQELCDGEPELCDIEQLLCSLRMLMCWWEHEAAGGETTSPYTSDGDDDMSEVALWLAAQPEQEKAMGDTKTVTTTPPTIETKTVTPDTGATATETTGTAVVPAKLTELVKAAVAEATQASDERVKALEAELAKVKATPVPGGPVIARTGDAVKSAERSEQIAHFRYLAKTVTDRDLRTFYGEQVKKLASQNGSES